MKILVVGDTILDYYVQGSVSRVNPEAPYSVIFDLDSSFEHRLGGAANVAANIRSLCPDDTIHYFGWTSDQISDMFSSLNISINEEMKCDSSSIILKTRFVSNNHYLLRVDKNKSYEYEDEDKICAKLRSILKFNNYDLVVCSDYNKGTITKSITETIISNSSKVLFDLKKRKNLFLKPYTENLILKCNEKEFDEEVSSEMVKSVKSLIKTLGANGCDVYFKNSIHHFDSPYVESVSDVVGAGDSFLAGMVCYFCETSLFEPFAMAQFGNKCASEKVRHFGTHCVKREDVL